MAIGGLMGRAFDIPKEKILKHRDILYQYICLIILIYGVIYGLITFIAFKFNLTDDRPPWAAILPLVQTKISERDIEQ